MKQTITKSMFRDAFNNRKDNFSYDGLGILFDYLEELESACNEELELDPISLCCDYREDDLGVLMDDYSMNLKELKENTIVLDVGMGQVIIQSF